jgi:hypothetical protein
MKTTLLAVLACLSFSALADSLIDARLDRLQRASRSGEMDRLSSSEKDLVKQGLDQAISVLRLDDGRPSPRPDYRPQPNPIPDYRPIPNGNGNGSWRRNDSYDRNEVAVYSDDYCTESQKITDIRAHEGCDRLSVIFGQSRAWSVKINGKCVDVPDTSFGQICPSLGDLARAQKPRSEDLVAYSDDYCTPSAKTVVIDPGVDCNALGGVLRSTRVWSVKLNGQCVDVADTQFSSNLCMQYQDGVMADYDNMGNRRRGDIVEMFSDDYCTGSAKVYDVKIGTDCNALNGIFSNKKIWSVRFRGQCVDIQDTTFLPACQSYSAR